MLAEWGKQRSSGDYCRWGAVGSRTFPLIKKETMTLGIPNLWMSWKIKRITLKGNTCQSGAISDQSIWTKRRLFPSHYHLPCSNMAQGMKIQGGREKEPCRMDTSALPGRSPGPQQGRGKHWIGWIWEGADTWLTWTWETQSDGRCGMAARWCRRWGCSGEWATTAPGEDEPVHLCICCGLSLCVPQKFHMIKSWFPLLWHP